MSEYKTIAESKNFIVLDQYIREWTVAEGYQSAALLGTRFTMEQDFYKGRLQDKFVLEVLEVLVPGEAQRERVHRIIYDELCLGEIRASSRAEYLAIIAGLAATGTTEIDNIYHIERGYEDIVRKLSGLGADIRVVVLPDEVSNAQRA